MDGESFIEIVNDGFDLGDFFNAKKKMLLEKDNVDILYIANLGEVINKMDLFKECLPYVEPFYAVKCNPDPVVSKLLSESGFGFDCASKTEIEAILNLGTSPDKIVFAHTVKSTPHLEYARKHNVSMMTFDNESELGKIKKTYPDAKLIMRINVDSSKSANPMGIKFGVKQGSIKSLLEKAKEMNLNVIGVSFHVGSGCTDLATYSAAVREARKAFDQGASLGFRFTLLDIGGGFPGARGTEDHFRQIAKTLAVAFEEHFPPSSGIRIIAEPGRYFSDQAFSCACEVVGVRESSEQKSFTMEGSNRTLMEYFLSDSIHQSFRFPGKKVEPNPITRCEEQNNYQSVLWGVSCGPLDCIAKNIVLPKMETGDLLYFENMGAYSLAMGNHFNGFGNVKILYVIPESQRARLAHLQLENGIAKDKFC